MDFLCEAGLSQAQANERVLALAGFFSKMGHPIPVNAQWEEFGQSKSLLSLLDRNGQMEFLARCGAPEERSDALAREWRSSEIWEDAELFEMALPFLDGKGEAGASSWGLRPAFMMGCGESLLGYSRERAEAFRPKMEGMSKRAREFLAECWIMGFAMSAQRALDSAAGKFRWVAANGDGFAQEFWFSGVWLESAPELDAKLSVRAGEDCAGGGAAAAARRLGRIAGGFAGPLSAEGLQDRVNALTAGLGGELAGAFCAGLCEALPEKVKALAKKDIGAASVLERGELVLQTLAASGQKGKARPKL